ncbi:MAG: hypothetical protein ABSG25_16085 [Bryobacteraceae bacterium]
MALLEVFWSQVQHAVETYPQGRKGVKSALERTDKKRNKNTYTAWFGGEPTALRPDIKLSAVEDIAAVLNVPPAELLSQNGKVSLPTPLQLELPFQEGSRTAELEIECQQDRLVLRARH